VQYKGSETVDAATLLMPLVKSIGPTDPRWLSTMRAIEEDLVSDSLVFRYKIGEQPMDGLSGTEGTFSACSFWYVECLSRMGDLDQARFFSRKLSATPITSVFSLRKSARVDSTWVTFHRHSPI
jgi:GH15 family glucan-1,4-alpha-glucosidase